MGARAQEPEPLFIYQRTEESISINKSHTRGENFFFLFEKVIKIKFAATKVILIVFSQCVMIYEENYFIYNNLLAVSKDRLSSPLGI